MTKLSRNQIFFLALLGAALVGLLAIRLVPGRADGKNSPIVIGVLAPFGTTPGEGIRNGVAMAVDEINRAGGIDGRPLRISEIDTAFTIQKAVAGYQQLAGPGGAAAVLGIAGDGIFAVMEQLAEFKTPMIGTGVAADRLTQMVAENPEKYRYYFRVMHRSAELADVTSRFARELLHGELGMRRFAILVENAVWTEALRASWEQAIRETPGMELVYADSFSSETGDFQPIFSRIKASGADYVLDASSKVEATQYLKQWAAVQGPPIGAVPTGAGTKRYYDQIGERGISVCSVSTIPDEVNQATEKSAAWWRAYRERYGDPEYTSAYSYDAVHILKEAIERAGTTEPEALVQALEATHHLGAAARWVFAADHHPRYGPGYRTIPIIQYYQPGPYGYRIIWPQDRAQGEFVFPEWLAGRSGPPAAAR